MTHDTTIIVSFCDLFRVFVFVSISNGKNMSEPAWANLDKSESSNTPLRAREAIEATVVRDPHHVAVKTWLVRLEVGGVVSLTLPIVW